MAAANEDVVLSEELQVNSDVVMKVLTASTQSEAAKSEEVSSEKQLHVDATLAAQGAHATPNSSKAEDVLTWSNTPSSLSTSAARLKWCGCLASAPCSHFTDYYLSKPAADHSHSFFAHHHHQHQHHPQLHWLPTASPHSSFHQLNAGVNLHSIELQYLSSKYDLRQLSKLKAQILAHPMYDQLLSAHVACLRVATPIDHLQSIEAQLNTNVPYVAARYKSILGGDQLQSLEEKEELDHFMANYIVFLHSFKEQLHEHVRVQAMDAVMSCWEIEKAFVNLTGVSPGEGSGATMSEGEEGEEEGEAGAGAGSGSRAAGAFSSSNMLLLGGCSNLDLQLEGMDGLGLGPLLPTESERSLMERVRLELKSELKQGYKNRIADVREEILRKRRAGKLPPETTALLKKWWNAHSKWPYPTEDEKARLVQETGLELKQINNWFINQRKRNWHSHASTASTTLPKNEASTSGGGGGGQQSSSNISLSLNCEGEKTQNYLQDAGQKSAAAGSFGETI